MNLFPHNSSVMWQHGQGRDAPTTPTHQRLEAGERAIPEFIRAGDLFLPLISCSIAFRRVAPIPPWDNTVELALK